MKIVQFLCYIIEMEKSKRTLFGPSSIFSKNESGILNWILAFLTLKCYRFIKIINHTVAKLVCFSAKSVTDFVKNALGKPNPLLRNFSSNLLKKYPEVMGILRNFSSLKKFRVLNDAIEIGSHYYFIRFSPKKTPF